MSTIIYRIATPDDLDALGQLRYEMELERPEGEAGIDRAAFLRAHGEVLREWLSHDGMHAWLAEIDGVPVASVVLLSWRMPPNARERMRRRGLVTNVYTRPAYRRQGIGRELMQRLIAHAHANSISRIVLWASQMGRPLYEELGFETERVMSLDL